MVTLLMWRLPYILLIAAHFEPDSSTGHLHTEQATCVHGCSIDMTMPVAANHGAALTLDRLFSRTPSAIVPTPMKRLFASLPVLGLVREGVRIAITAEGTSPES